MGMTVCERSPACHRQFLWLDENARTVHPINRTPVFTTVAPRYTGLSAETTVRDRAVLF